MALIAIDFDGTLVDGEVLLPGAREAINILREQGHKVVINSANNPIWIKKVLDNNDVRYDWIYGLNEKDGHKVIADLYVDDRGFHFKEWTEAVNDILKRVEGMDNRKWK